MIRLAIDEIPPDVADFYLGSTAVQAANLSHITRPCDTPVPDTNLNRNHQPRPVTAHHQCLRGLVQQGLEFVTVLASLRNLLDPGVLGFFEGEQAHILELPSLTIKFNIFQEAGVMIPDTENAAAGFPLRQATVIEKVSVAPLNDGILNGRLKVPGVGQLFPTVVRYTLEF